MFHRTPIRVEPNTKNVEALGVPMHPGAVTYYKSKGLWGN